MAKTRKPKTDHYQALTDHLVGLLEEALELNDEARWVKPWNAPGWAFAPRNAVTGRFYRGVNFMWLSLDPRNGEDPRWATYKQAQSKGWQVRKGETGTQVYLFKPVTFEQEDGAGGTEEKTVPVIRAFTVFHVSQMDGEIPPFESDLEPTVDPDGDGWVTNPLAEKIIEHSGAEFLTGSAAYYKPADDTITLPPRETFVSADAFYATALHELAHWTKKEHRVGRRSGVGGGVFGSEQYAKEEVRAEMASAILGSLLGLDPYHPEGDHQHINYLKGWLKAIKQDKYEVRRAAADAQKIVDWLVGDLYDEIDPQKEGEEAA